MSNDEASAVSKGLENLSAIKQGDDPRSSQDSTTVREATSDSEWPNDKLAVAVNEVDHLFEESARLRDLLDRDQIVTITARWKRRNGYCSYNSTIQAGSKRRFGQRLTKTINKNGYHLVGANERIGDKDDFIDTIRHEVAHAVAFAEYGSSQDHNQNWKRWARHLGADPSSCHNKKDNPYDYYVECIECGGRNGYYKRSKYVKQPWILECSCGSTDLVSYERGGTVPTESGVCGVESIPWDNKSEWVRR